MSHNSAWDSIEFPKLDLPYNRIESELSEKPRWIRGNNAIVTLGGKLCKRPGNLLLTGSVITDKRSDRLWIYETLESPPKVFIVSSMYDAPTTSWSMYYIRMSDTAPAWTQFSNLREINNSTRPHEAVVSRGLFYCKGYPSAASGEKLGTVIFDGSGSAPTFKFWGILPPDTPAALVGAVTTLNSDVSISDSTINVTSSAGFPAPNFTIQIDDEVMSVTNVVGLAWDVLRGVNGTIPAEHRTNTLVVWRDWTASDHQIDVNIGWGYTYAYKTSSGQISSRSPLETNPDKLPSRTGPFQDLIPSFTLTGHADTTNVPTIVVFRSTDGGGTYFELEEIPNTGGSITYLDDSFESGLSGGVFNDPVPDAELDQGTRATTLVSNNPPPTVTTPLVVGTDTPAASTPLASYSARIWLGIGNILFFSGNEEITLGIPEESWPSGTFGNFFRFQYPITNIAATSSALYIYTLQGTYELTGTNLETFNVKPIFENLGAPYGHPRAVTRYEDNIIFLSHDFRIGRVQDNVVEIISDPLYTDIVDAINADGSEIDIKYWGDLEKEWLFIAAHNTTNTSLSKQWVFDIKKSKLQQESFWFLPWTMRITAMASGRIDETVSQRRMIFAMYDQTTGDTCLVRMDPTVRTGSDYFITGTTGYTFDAVTNLFLVPPGNHVNKLRQPGITPVVYGFQYDRLLFAGDNDPQVYYYKDDFWSDPIEPLQSEDPARRDLSKQYKTLWYGVDEVAQHFAVEISKLVSKELFEMENLIILFEPDGGA